MRASPPNRCAQPVMSRNSPSVPSSATSGVKRSHQSAMAFSVLPSATGSASITSSAGSIARAVASGIPTTSPVDAAASFSATSCSALSILAATTSGTSSGGATPCCCRCRRRKRSVGRRGSHTLRIRLFAEKVLITRPFHDPSPGRAHGGCGRVRRRRSASPIPASPGPAANARRARSSASRRWRPAALRQAAASSAVTPLSPAASVSLRLATRSNARVSPQISATTAPSALQARPSAAVRNTMSAVGARTTTR